MSAGIQVLGKAAPEFAEILSPEALSFVAGLAREFEPRRRDLMAARTRLHHLFLEEETGPVFRTLPEPGAVDAANDEAYRALDPAYLRFTSGTTSRRKGVILGHGTVLARLSAANRRYYRRNSSSE